MPGILITPHNFQITMFDAENDILLCSNEIPLFLPPSDYCLNPRAVLTLWLVLHYRMFCSGLKLVDSYTLNKWKSNFKVFVDSKWEIYSTLLKDSVSSFSVAECMYNWKEMNMYTQSYLPGNCWYKSLKCRHIWYIYKSHCLSVLNCQIEFFHHWWTFHIIIFLLANGSKFNFFIKLKLFYAKYHRTLLVHLLTLKRSKFLSFRFLSCWCLEILLS